MPPPLRVKAPFRPSGDQPKAIRQLTAGVQRQYQRQTLLGITASGKTACMAWVIAKLQMPALIISHNKTLAAQLASELGAFFPDNAVEYFVSYYDYYQPEAYVPRTDTYIAKDASINQEIDRLRHSAMEAVLTRPDTVVVASVSCIYGLGSPADYLNCRLVLAAGAHLSREAVLRHLTRLHYQRHDLDLTPGTYRVHGDTVDIHPAGKDRLLRVEFFGPAIDRLTHLDEVTGAKLKTTTEATIFPATFFLTNRERQRSALADIRAELTERCAALARQGKELAAQRLRQRTTYDLEMITQVGYVSGIENYSRHLDRRDSGQPPATLLDYFRYRFGARGFLTFIDESHMSIPQLAGMEAGDHARKAALIEYGFRLPSAFDNRPLKFHECEDRLGPTIFVSATPGPYERNVSQQLVELIVRPTGLLDPAVSVRPTANQIDDVIDAITTAVRRHQRVLVTTLTKRLAEELSTYLVESGIKAAYLHSDINTLERLDILRGLRTGTYDVLVGINLLREGLDLPEVALVAILDADKEGYLRSATALIQTMGRAARHVEGRVIMYADRVTGSMREAMAEVARRRKIQTAFNRAHGITPRSIRKATTLTVGLTATERALPEVRADDIPPDAIHRVVKDLEQKMALAAHNLEFERAAVLRDAIQRLRRHERQHA